MLAEPETPPLGIPFDIWGRNVWIGEQRFFTGRGDGIWVAVDRATLETIDQGSWENTDLNDLPNILMLQSNALVAMSIVANPEEGGLPVENRPGSQNLDQFNKILSYIGGEAIPAATMAAANGKGLSVVGVPKSPPGSAYQNLGLDLGSDVVEGSGAISGYLPHDSTGTGKHAFTWADFAVLDTQAAGTTETQNKISVGSGLLGKESSYTSQQLGAGQAGFHVLALDQSSLRGRAGQSSMTLESAANEPGEATFVVNTGSGAAADEQAQSDMAAWLQKFAADPNALVVVQSIGAPKPTTPTWAKIASAIADMGGTAHVFNSLNLDSQSGPGYALVGSATDPDGAAEQSDVIACSFGTASSGPACGQSGRVATMLARDRSGMLGPATSDPLGSFNHELLPAVYGTQEKGFAALSPGEQAASEYLALNVLDPKMCTSAADCAGFDIRSQYTNDKYAGDWITFTGQLQSHNCSASQPGVDFEPADCQALIDELTAEMPNVSTVTKLLGSDGEFKDMYVGSFLWDYVEIENNITTKIIKSVEPRGDTTGDVLDMISAVLSVLSEVAAFEAGPTPTPRQRAGGLAGIASGLFWVASSAFALAPDGSPLGRIEAEADDLANDLSTSVQAAVNQFEQIGNAILINPDLLELIGPPAGSGDALWSWGDDVPGDSTVKDTQGALSIATQQWAWAQLLGTLYSVTQIQGVGKAEEFRCRLGAFDESAVPFAFMADNQLAQTPPLINGFSTDGKMTPLTTSVAVLAQKISGTEPRTWPGNSLLQPLFQPLSATDGLALYRPTFYSARNFKVQSVQQDQPCP